MNFISLTKKIAGIMAMPMNPSLVAPQRNRLLYLVAVRCFMYDLGVVSLLLRFALMLSVSVTSAYGNPITIRENDKVDKLTTRSGDVYENVTIREIKKSGVQIIHSYGARTIPAYELPEYAFLFKRIQEPEKNVSTPAISWQKLTLVSGKAYDDVKVNIKYPDGISVTHSTGGAKIPYEQLPLEIRQAVGGFTENGAKAFRAKENEDRIKQAQRAAKLDAQKRYPPTPTKQKESTLNVETPRYTSNSLRVWTNTETGRTLEAKLVAKSKKGTHVELQKADSKKVIIKTNKLSVKDQYIISQMNVAELKSRPGGLKLTARTVSWGTKRSSWSYIWGNVDSAGAQLLSYSEKNRDSHRQLGVDLRPTLNSKGGDYIVEVFWFGFPLSKKSKRYVCAAGIKTVSVPPSGTAFGIASNYNYKESSLLYLESDPSFRYWEGLYVRTWSGYTYAGWAVRVSDGYGKVVAIQGAQTSFLRHINDIPIPRIK